MKAYRRNRARVSLSLGTLMTVAVLCLAAGVAGEAGAESRVVAIAHDQVDADSLARNSARAMFAMRLRSWPDGTPARVFVLDDDDPLHMDFTKQVLEIYPYQLRAAWDRLIFSGTGQAPVTVGSTEEMLDRVARTPGAIGYLQEGKVDERVRVLELE